MNPIRTLRYLGAAIIALGCLQLTLYFIQSRQGGLELFYFEPRIGFLIFADSATPGPGPIQWLSGVWEVVIGAAVLLKPRMVEVYLISEALLALPSLLFFVMIVLANLSPAHGFSVGELLIPLPIFLAFSVFPWFIGFRARRSLVRDINQPIP